MYVVFADINNYYIHGLNWTASMESGSVSLDWTTDWTAADWNTGLTFDLKNSTHEATFSLL